MFFISNSNKVRDKIIKHFLTFKKNPCIYIYTYIHTYTYIYIIYIYILYIYILFIYIYIYHLELFCIFGDSIRFVETDIFWSSSINDNEKRKLRFMFHRDMISQVIPLA